MTFGSFYQWRLNHSAEENGDMRNPLINYQSNVKHYGSSSTGPSGSIAWKRSLSFKTGRQTRIYVEIIEYRGSIITYKKQKDTKFPASKNGNFPSYKNQNQKIERENGSFLTVLSYFMALIIWCVTRNL